MSNQPVSLKVNYAKGRMKSKTKNQVGSQQKIPFQGQSSADIFAHLNQDNLNYIKKQLKNKKSHQNHERVKSSNAIQITQSKILQMKGKQKQKTLQQQRMYEKYKNQNQVAERDSREEETMRETQVDDEISSQIEKSMQQAHSNNQDKKYLGLNPPPLTLKTYKQSLPSTESQHMKTASLQLQQLQKKANVGSKINFLQYELKSQNSHQQIANSMLSVQNQLSDQYSTNIKASQFIGYLQNYIEELNSSPSRQKHKDNRNLSFKIRNQQSSGFEKEDYQQKILNFRKFKPLQDQHSLNNKQEQIIHSYRSSNSQFHGSISLKKSIKQRNTNDQYLQKKFNINHIKNQYLQNKDNVHKTSQTNQMIQTSNINEIKDQLQRQKNYCIVLALELQKYKKNQIKYSKEQKTLSKTVEFLKEQIQGLKQTIKQQRLQTQKLLKLAKNQERTRKQSDYLFGQSKRNYNLQQPLHLFFKQFMKFSSSEPIYSRLDSRIYNEFKRQFEKGKENYWKDLEKRRQEKSSRVIKRSYRDETNVYEGGNQDNNLSSSRRDRYSEGKQYFSPNSQYAQNINLVNRRENRLKSKIKYNNIEQQNLDFSRGLEIKKPRSSLEKLKDEYQRFKLQIGKQRPKHQNQRQKIKSFRNNTNLSSLQKSPTQFAGIFVK